MSRGRGAPLVGWVVVLVLGACSSKVAPSKAVSAPGMNDAERGVGGDARTAPVKVSSVTSYLPRW